MLYVMSMEILCTMLWGLGWWYDLRGRSRGWAQLGQWRRVQWLQPAGPPAVQPATPPQTLQGWPAVETLEIISHHDFCHYLWIGSHDQVFERSHFPTVLLLMCGPAGAGDGPGWVDGGRLGPGSLAADCRLQQPPLQHCRRPPADLEPLQLHRPALQGGKGLHFPRMILGTLLGIHLSDV